MKETLGLWSFQMKWENYHSCLLKINQLKQLPPWYGQRDLMCTYRSVLWFQICIYYHHLTLAHFNDLLWDLLKYLLFSSVQSLSCLQIFATPWIATCQASPSITNSQSLLRLMSIESVMPSNNVVPFSCLQSFPVSGSFQMSQVAEVLEFKLQHQSFQWIFRTDFL